MPLGSPLPPRKAKIEADKLEERKRLLEKRRNPSTKAKVKFRARLQEFKIEVATEGSEETGVLTVARDIPFTVQAMDGIKAVQLVLEQLKLHPGELIHVIHVGPPKWLPREPIGRQDNDKVSA